MPVSMVYEGIAGGGSADLLFSGIRFWLATRLPTRKDWITKIQASCFPYSSRLASVRAILT